MPLEPRTLGYHVRAIGRHLAPADLRYRGTRHRAAEGLRQQLSAETHAQQGDSGVGSVTHQLHLGRHPGVQQRLVVHRPRRAERDDDVVACGVGEAHVASWVPGAFGGYDLERVDVESVLGERVPEERFGRQVLIEKEQNLGCHVGHYLGAGIGGASGLGARGVAMDFARRRSLIGMGKLIYGFNVSVDGYIADAQGNIDWSDPCDELHQYWNDFERETAVSLYGRRLYELMSAYWPTADETPDATPLIVDFAQIWRDMPKVVFSRTLQSVDWNSRLERGDPVEVVTKLKAETDGQLEVAGATLAAPIVQAGLVDEYRLLVAPTAVGGGTPFFPTLPSWISLRLVENRTFPGGVVLLRYAAKND
jgi:dihydrofolate reductase